MADSTEIRRSKRGPSITAVHAGAPRRSIGQPISGEIFQTSTFVGDPAGEGEVLYTRYGNNPNHRRLEARIAALEGAEACLVTGSGMGAMSGHSDVTAGAVCGSQALVSQARQRAQLFGTAIDPHAAWLVERGIKTLAVPDGETQRLRVGDRVLVREPAGGRAGADESDVPACAGLTR